MMCCKLFTIPDLVEVAGNWCPNANPGHGCGMYVDRPKLCKTFECMWRKDDLMPDDFRPDKVRAILAETEGRIVGYFDPTRTDMNKLLSGKFGHLLKRLSLVKEVVMVESNAKGRKYKVERQAA